MGGSESKHSTIAHVYRKVKPVGNYQSEFEILGLTESDVGNIYAAFSRIDIDETSVIKLDELLAFLRAERTPFTGELLDSSEYERNNDCFRIGVPHLRQES